MPTFQTPGIVLSRSNFGEADRVIRFLTPYHGKISAVAKGVRRIKSRLAGHLEPFAETSLMLATGKNLDIVTSARLIWYPHNLTSSISRLNLAFMTTLAVDRLTESGQSQPKLYELLRATLHDIDSDASGSLMQLWFKLNLLNTLGYRPDLTECSLCDASDQATKYYLSASSGSLVCMRHDPKDAVFISMAGIKLWRLIFDNPYVTIAKIDQAEAISYETLPACDLLYEHHLGRTFNVSPNGEPV
jgi:DNA repair protein RecO (recombination protein O)